MAKSILLNGRRISSIVKSVQRGTITLGIGVTSNTATVNTVDVNNARLKFCGFSISAGGLNREMCSRITLTNSTTLTVNVNTATATSTVIVSYELIEYWPGVVKNIQRGTVAGNSGTATITAVDITKSEVDYLGSTGSDANTNITSVGRVSLTNATTVTGVGVGGVNDTIGYQVVEFN